MPDQTPAPEPDAVTPKDAESAATLLDDPNAAGMVGGGGLGGAAAAVPPHAPLGTAASAPIDVPTPDESEDFGDPRASLAAREEAAAAAAQSSRSQPN